MPRCILCLETTCDETAAAILSENGDCLAEAVASQMDIHERFDGVVPELAARAHLDRIVPIVETVLSNAQVGADSLEAIAVATEPGLPGSLLVGLAAAKGLCLAWGKPLVTINHVHAHIYACQLSHHESVFPCVGFVVSGGHTNLYRCDSADTWTYLGGTIDDAVGEAFDKVAVMLGLPYPGGPHISRLATEGNSAAYSLPRPMKSDQQTLNMSFSGLKTAVRYKIVGTGKQDFSHALLTHQQRCDLAASFQKAAIECLVAKSMQALTQTGLKRLCVGGGVAANELLRSELTEACHRRDIELIVAPPNLCTDNAVMGAIAWEKVATGNFAPLDADITPGLLRA